ncbi:delta-like protein 4 [Saccostrea echinata]|uniref:delta-like protein 4 n=1 Tax=Saccostrea echinata TaxID=191078 RepID=UPI002A7F8D14|nr:delta-like protein 4 [Saccostrea echinata]
MANPKRRLLKGPPSVLQDNIALNKPTQQSHAYSSPNHPPATFDSSNAVDGLKSDLSAFGGQCVISADGFNIATWWVNLTSIHSIHDIRIYYRTGNKAWGTSNGFTERFLGFFVYVSNTTNRVDARLCFHNPNYVKATIPAFIYIKCVVHGQYVIYYNYRPQQTSYPSQFSTYAYNELCEVEVNGCKKTGYYGSNCSLPCPDTNCRYCHIETGACQGCKPGYKGHQCELQCGNKTYGDGCEEICGACKDHKQCQHINGSCLHGCEAGYKGELCNTGCSSGDFGRNCKEKCSENCGAPYKCSREKGECEGGCQPGWEGLQCKNSNNFCLSSFPELKHSKA